ncbi:S8 family serine peptidase [Mucilaginibacter agri]|uniref:S8 family serine peptidase n=1 Tax=Mucilaginibacter agri TaxID=2695265 RepID=A0A966DUB5_9SPHI|nr:S8 family serine peptidase [Mucilaginibacter agri]NCD71545.1 S8 family serine peptidase [Mucilaginibacter agri]
MNKSRFAIALSFVSCLLFSRAQAQQPLVSEAKKAELNASAQQLNQIYEAQRKQFPTLALKYNWNLSSIRKDGGIMRLHRITDAGFPVFVKTDNNTTSAATTRTNLVQPGGSLNLGLSGSSTFLNGKLAIFDGGAVLTSHQEFAGKTITIKTTGASVLEHSTHVAGTMIAKGVYAPAKGMSFGANTLNSYTFDNDVADMTAAASSLLLSNHSYGTVAGWDYDGTRWNWYGKPGDTEDYQFGFYGTQAHDWDNIAYNAPYYLIVESAGNNRIYNGPAVGDDYWGERSRTDPTFVDKGARPAGISSNDSYDIIPDYANSKNIMTVGAVNALPFGPSTRSDVSIATFSSWGPTDDGRVKPDICGMGVNVLSTGSSSNNSYVILSGTSMAAPNVTGSLLLLQEYYAKQNGGKFMHSATLKGLACHTAFDSGNIGPDYIYGWGLLDMAKAAQAITDNGTKSLVIEDVLTQGQTKTIPVVASGDGVLMASISWTDPAAAATADGTLNSRTPKLVNDLDIRISDGTTTFMPWVLNPDQPAVAATTGDNIRDNIEQVYIANVVPGKQYTITISHKNTLQSGSQAYSLIVTGVGGAAYCTSAPASSADSRINKFTLSNVTNTPVAGCTTYADYSGTYTVQLEPGKTYPLSLTLGTCGSNFNKIAKVFIDWNADGDFDDSGEVVATSGVINATGVFNASVTVPTGVTIGNYTRLRVVLTETSDPAAVTACGTYAKGETEDYRVQFVQPALDAGVVAVNSSTASGACAGPTKLVITIRNFGTQTLSTIPVTLTVTAPDNTVTTFNETFTGSITPGSQADYTFTNTYTTLAGVTYTITGATKLPNDLVVANDQTTTSLVIGSVPVASNLSAYYCNNTNSYQLSGTASDGTLLWYSHLNDVIPIAAGSPASTNTAPIDNTYYAGINDFSGTVGPTTKAAFTGGGYNQYTPAINVTTQAPMVLESARLYIGNAGKITFTVADASGQIVSTTTINAALTRSVAVPPTAGNAADDAADQGAVYPLNLIFPSAGAYTINISYDDDATIFRSNAGVTGYPFTIGGIFSITGNTATPNSTSYYYYLYDMHIRSYGCSSASRMAVTLTKPLITQNVNVLSSNYATGNQWYYNGTLITGATEQTFKATESGNYQVSVAVSGTCTALSDNFAFAQTALHPDNSTDIGLTIFPVPASSTLNVLFVAKTGGDLSMSFINSLGQVMYTDKRTVTEGNFSTALNVNGLPPGTYVLRIILADKLYAKKVIIVR